MKKVSIIIPIYNVKPYLVQCLESVLQQRYQEWEAILIDDGSSDGSEKICDDFAVKDRRFHVIHQENRGAANAKNAGLEYASGEYIAFLDSDDFVELNWLERVVNEAELSNADIVEYTFCKVYTDHKEQEKSKDFRHAEYKSEDYLALYLNDWTCSLFWNKLFSARLLQGIRFRKERRCIDDEFFTYKAISEAKKIIRIDDILYYYRQRASSAVSSEKNRKQITDDALEILIERYKWVTSRFPKLRKTYLYHDIDILFYFAREFLFTKQTVRKFFKVRNYYLKECLFHWSGVKVFFIALQLYRYAKSKLLENKSQQIQMEDKEYYL